MPVMGAGTERTVAVVTVLLSGLILVFNTIPLLNIAPSTSLFNLVTVSQLLGVVLLYIFYKMWQKHI